MSDLRLVPPPAPDDTVPLVFFAYAEALARASVVRGDDLLKGLGAIVLAELEELGWRRV